jgi:hypothetical protein
MRRSMPRQQKANELESTITGIDDTSKDGVAELDRILRANYGMLRKSFKGY